MRGAVVVDGRHAAAVRRVERLTEQLVRVSSLALRIGAEYDLARAELAAIEAEVTR